VTDTAPGRADPLGILARFASTFPDGRARRYYLQSQARELLPGERVSKCLRKTLGDPEVWFSPEFKKSHYARLVTCGDVWKCPVCAAKITERRRQELKEAECRLKREKGFTYSTLMETFTSAHSREDKFEDLIEYNNQAFRKLKSGRWWIEFEAKYGIVGSIAGTEPTWGSENGWHFHKHVNFFFTIELDEVIAEEIRAELASKWAEILDDMGRYSSQIYGVVGSAPSNTWDDYFAKWGIAEEITKYPTKKGRGGYSPFDLLALAGAGEEWAGALFQEYGRAMKGRRQLVYSKGLKPLLGMTQPEKSDEVLASEAVEVGDILLAQLSKNQWNNVLILEARLKLLMIADSGNTARVHKFIVDLELPARLERERRWGNYHFQADPASP
jgi:hypothetical protein